MAIVASRRDVCTCFDIDLITEESKGDPKRSPKLLLQFFYLADRPLAKFGCYTGKPLVRVVTREGNRNNGRADHFRIVRGEVAKRFLEDRPVVDLGTKYHLRMDLDIIVEQRFELTEDVCPRLVNSEKIGTGL